MEKYLKLSPSKGTLTSRGKTGLLLRHLKSETMFKKSYHFIYVRMYVHVYLSLSPPIEISLMKLLNSNPEDVLRPASPSLKSPMLGCS